MPPDQHEGGIRQAHGHRGLQHGEAQVRLGGEGDLVGHPGHPAPLTVLRPGLRQVQAPAEEGVTTRGGVGEHHHDLAVADVTGRPAVLVSDPDGLVTLLDHLRVVQHQRRTRIPQLPCHVRLHLGQQSVRAPGRLTKELLDPVRGGMPGPPSHRPAVLPAQVRQQPLDKIGEHLPRLRPGEQMPQPARQDSQSLGPVPDMLRTDIHQHDRTTISTDHQSHDLRL